MSKIHGAIIFVLALCLVPTANLAAAEPAAPTPVAQAVAAIKLKSSWDRIEITEESPKRYSLSLWYKPAGKIPRPRLAEAEADTKQVARAVLAQLLKESPSPVKDRISVSVWAFQSGLKGENGEPLNIAFGATDYDYTRDQLEFRDWKTINGGR